MSVAELIGSELGTKEYWEKAYEREIKNYRSHGDVGEIWFDEDSQFRVINWLIEHNIKRDVRIIDLGCGNGMLLVELAREGYTNLLGVDYCSKAVELAKNIAKDQHLIINFKEADLMNVKSCSNDLGKFGVVHDKGTYDAISLFPDNPKEKRELYIESVRSIMDEESLFIITSCNWTEDELITSFHGKFEKICTIPTPSFKFGGKVGSVVSSVVFKKL